MAGCQLEKRLSYLQWRSHRDLENRLFDMSSPEEVSDGVGEEQLGREIGSDNPVLALSLEEPLLLVEDE